MKIKKIVLLAMLLILDSITYLYAGGANEGNIYYFPRSVVDNRNLMIELAGEHALTTSDIKADFENTSENQMAFFRLRDSLKSNVSVGAVNNTNVTLTIESLDNWKFVHETNTTSTRPFTLSAFCTEQVESGREYYPQNAVELLLNSNVQLTGSSVNVKFSEDGGVYSLVFPTTTFREDQLSLYARFIRDFDFCVVLHSVPPGTYLESGYYTTRLKISFSTFVRSEAYSRYFWEKVVHRNYQTTMDPITITLRGYVGITPEMSEEPFFIVTSTDYTYTMDLAPDPRNNPRYHIANLSFTNSKLSNTDPDGRGVPDTDKGGKYEIYVSPTRVYNASGKYYFIKMGTENEARKSDNTIYYDLYTTPSAGTKINENDKPYAFKPDFTSPKISSSGWAGGEDVWKYTWNLNQNLYLQVLDPSTPRQSGLYYSYIYFTLVTY